MFTGETNEIHRKDFRPGGSISLSKLVFTNALRNGEVYSDVVEFKTKLIKIVRLVKNN